MIELDERGHQCPLPVVAAKKALEQANANEQVSVRVDNEIAVQNLMKLGKHMNLTVNSEKQGEDNYVVNFVMGDVSRSSNTKNSEETALPSGGKRNLVVVIASDQMGEPEEELGKILMKGFIFALAQQDILPKTILFYNSGARLTTTGSESLEDLKNLEAEGVEIMTCGTCLKYLGIEKELQVGTVSNMYDIAEKMVGADLIVRP